MVYLLERVLRVVHHALVANISMAVVLCLLEPVPSVSLAPQASTLAVVLGPCLGSALRVQLAPIAPCLV